MQREIVATFNKGECNHGSQEEGEEESQEEEVSTDGRNHEGRPQASPQCFGETAAAAAGDPH
jgi:hypothetical protein